MKAVSPRSLQAELDRQMDCLADQIMAARRMFPRDDYAGRIYRCDHCESIDFACAPFVDLVDDYPCPECGRPQVAVVEPGVPG